MKIWVTKSYSHLPLEVGNIYKNPDAALYHLLRYPNHEVYEAELTIPSTKPLTMTELKAAVKQLSIKILKKK